MTLEVYNKVTYFLGWARERMADPGRKLNFSMALKWRGGERASETAG